jgi:hypothetical protein
MKGVLNHSRNRIKEIRKNQPNRQSGETFRIVSTKYLLLLYPELEDVSARQECVMAQIVSFSMSDMFHGQNCMFHHGFNVSCSQSTNSACLEYVMVKIVRFIMSGMCYGQNCPFQHVLIVPCSISSVLACLECVMVYKAAYQIKSKFILHIYRSQTIYHFYQMRNPIHSDQHQLILTKSIIVSPKPTYLTNIYSGLTELLPISYTI